MTKTFTYTFRRIVRNDGVEKPTSESDFHIEEITLKKRVTDKMEERDSWKRVYAADYFAGILRTEYGRPRAVVLARELKEV